MKQLYTLLLLALCLIASAGLNAQTITFEENSSEFNNRTITLTLEGQENGRNRYANRNVGDDFADVVIRWTGTRWVITDGNDMGGTNPGMAFVIYANDYDVGPNPPSFNQGNWEVVLAGEELVRLEGDGTQAVTLAWTLTAGPFTTDAGVQTGLGGGTPAGGIYSGPGVTDDGNGMTFSFDPMAAGVGTATVSYGAGDNVVVRTIEVTQGGPTITVQFGNNTFILTQDPMQVNGRNAYSNENYSLEWKAFGIWVIEQSGFVLTFSSYDVGPNPPDLATGNWNNPTGEILRIDGSGTQAVTLGFTLEAGPFTTDAGVQTGLGGGTPMGGIYSGPGVTDDGNGMSFSFDPMAAGVGTATISYGAGDNTVTQTVEVEEAVAQINFGLVNGLTAQLNLTGEVNGRNNYEGLSSSGDMLMISWSGTRWEIADAVGVFYASNYDVSPNPPDFTSGNWILVDQSVAMLSLLDGSGTQSVDLGFTLDAGPFTTDDGVQAGLSGGTPAGGIYSGPGVTDDGNGMTFSFDPMAAGVGTATISYGDGPDGANNVTQTIEVTEALDQIAIQLTNINNLVIDGSLVANGTSNGRNSYQGSVTTGDILSVVWSGSRWEITIPGTVLFFSNYDVSPNPPDLVSGNWQISASNLVQSLNIFSGSGTQAVELGFTLEAGPFTTEDGVQAGLSGGTPAGGIYSGPGVTDDGNGMTFSFDPAAAGSGMITISYGDGPDGANNATQMVEVIDLSEVCVVENDSQNNFSNRPLAGQSFTACFTGRLTSIEVDVRTPFTGVLQLNRGADTAGEDYTQNVSATNTGRITFTLDEPFIVLQDSLYAFSFTNAVNANVELQASSSNPYDEGNFFDDFGALTSADLVFRLITEIDTNAVSTRPDLLTSVVNLTAFPNPTAGDFTVAYDLAEQSEVAVVLYDQQGRVLRKLAQGRQAVGAQRVTITDNSLPAGVLYYGLQTERGHSAVKAIVVR